jgi:SsrA-binding protein
MKVASQNVKILATNRRASHDYHLHDKFEAGLELRGTEVKSAREGKISFKDSYVEIRDDEAFLLNCHIAEYPFGNRQNHDPTRPRKLLLHRRELNKLAGKVTMRGYTIVPLKVYLKHGLVKMEIALATGKKLYDKREAEKERTIRQDIRRMTKS